MFRDAFIGAKRWVWSDDLAMKRAPFDVKVLFDIIEARVQRARNDLTSYYKTRSRQLSRRGRGGLPTTPPRQRGPATAAVDVARASIASPLSVSGSLSSSVTRRSTPVDILSILESDDSDALDLLERRRRRRAAGLDLSFDASEQVFDGDATAAASHTSDAGTRLHEFSLQQPDSSIALRLEQLEAQQTALLSKLSQIANLLAQQQQQPKQQPSKSNNVKHNKNNNDDDNDADDDDDEDSK